MKSEPVTKDTNALFQAFVACLIVISLPVKNFSYVTPALYLLILWWHGERRLLGRVVVLCSVVALISGIALLWDHLSGRTVNPPGLWLALLTYSPLFVVLCETFSRTIDQATYDKFARVCAWFILFQSVVGLIQYVATGNTDAVCGTMGLFDGFVPSITIVQVYFTFVVFGMMLFLAPVANQRLNQVAIAAGILVCVLGQSGHQNIFFVVALVGCSLTRMSRIGTVVRTVVAAAVLCLLVVELDPETFEVAQEWYRRVTDSSDSPKRMVYEGALSILEGPKNMLIGTGLGQYTSRASLMTSNEYLNVSLPPFFTGKSDYFEDYISPSLVLFEEIGEGSAMAKPYMTMISLPVELGLVVSIVLLAVICRRFVWCAGLMAGNGEQIRWIGLSMMAGTLFFVLCCFIENYGEFSQAIFVPFILYIVAGSRARTIQQVAQNSLLTNRLSPREFAGRTFRRAAPVLPR